MTTYDLGLADHEKAEFLEAARLCGYWLVNCQNTEKRPWGDMHFRTSADLGRFIEKCCPSREHRPAAGWGLDVGRHAQLLPLGQGLRCHAKRRGW